MKPYVRFAAMVAASTATMYGLTYLNVASADHVFFSQTRLWMALMMGAAMAVVMLCFMRGMYRDRRANAVVVAICTVVFAGSLWLVRSQALVGDVAYMKAMIPHHSIAILTSRNAQIEDPRVRALADDILQAQVREIGEMKDLIADLEGEPAERH